MGNEVAESKSSMVMPIVWMALALLYDISPVDIIPDIPVIGWVDDFFVTATATLNFIQKAAEDSEEWLATIAKTLKWIIVLLGVIAILLILLCGTLIMGLFS